MTSNKQLQPLFKFEELLTFTTDLTLHHDLAEQNMIKTEMSCVCMSFFNICLTQLGKSGIC